MARESQCNLYNQHDLMNVALLRVLLAREAWCHLIPIFSSLVGRKPTNSWLWPSNKRGFLFCTIIRKGSDIPELSLAMVIYKDVKLVKGNSKHLNLSTVATENSKWCTWYIYFKYILLWNLLCLSVIIPVIFSWQLYGTSFCGTFIAIL